MNNTDLPTNLKIFNDSKEISNAIGSILIKEFHFDFGRLDKKQRILKNIEVLPSNRDPTLLKLKGQVVLPIEEKIHPSTVITMGYNAGQPCRIAFYPINSNYEQFFPFIRRAMHKVTGYMTFAKPYYDGNEICYEIDVSIDLPYEDNDNISCADFYMKHLTNKSSVFFECIPTRYLPFSTNEDAVEDLSDLWRNGMGEAFLTQLVKNHKPTTTFHSTINDQSLHMQDHLDEAQQLLAASICSNKKIISCLAPAGCGKTQAICSALLTSIENENKRFLFVGPTNRSCEAIMERFLSWAPDPSKILIIKSRAAMVRHPDRHSLSEMYYKRKGLLNIIDKMESKDKHNLRKYLYYKKHYGELKTKPVEELTQEYFNTLNIAKGNLKNFETFLPGMIMKYFKPQVFVCTIDLTIKGLPIDYTKGGFDYIIVDEASQVRTATAIVLINKFKNSNICYLGDLQQLPPYKLYGITLSEQESVLSVPILNLMKNSGYSNTVRLTSNYRSHPKLVNLLSDLFYDGHMNPRRKDNEYHLQHFNFIKCRFDNTYDNSYVYPFYLFDIRHASKSHESGSTYNVGEAHDISTLVLHFFLIDYDPNNLAIICLYKAQINEIRRSITNLLDLYDKYIPPSQNKNHWQTSNYNSHNYIKSLLIDTVDAFQGHEKEFVIISTCRSSIRVGDIVTDFFDLTNRACVALTRPKIGFFLFGDTLLMKDAPTWNNILNYMNERNTVIEFTRDELSRIFPTVYIDENFKNTHLRI